MARTGRPITIHPEWVREQHGNGLTDVQMAAILGVTPAGIAYQRKKLGLTENRAATLAPSAAQEMETADCITSPATPSEEAI